MNDVRSIRFHPAVAVITALAALCLAAGAAAAVPPLTVDDIVALLDAGVGESVILKQASASRTRLVLTVDMLIQLKKAGASDDLLEALVASPARDVQRPDPLRVPQGVLQGDTVHAFRVYSELDEDGDAVVHITNLDASGRRIGGEVEPSVPANVVLPSEPTARREEPYREARSYDDGDRGQVVVNVYPPDSGSGGAPESYEPDRYDRYYNRYAPAYYGSGWSNHHFHSPTCGHPYYYYGRYTPYGYPAHHGLRGGRLGHGVGVPYLGSIRTVPYSFSSSAAARNRKAFGRR